MPSASTSGTSFEALFHATSLDLIIPSTSAIPASGSAEDWWQSVQAAPARHVSFLGMSYISQDISRLRKQQAVVASNTPSS